MIGILYAVSLALAAAALVDQLRRDESAWVAAGRDRGWWSGVTAALGLLGCGAPIALLYLVGVLPRFGRRPGADPAFRKGAPPPPPARDDSRRIVVTFD